MVNTVGTTFRAFSAENASNGNATATASDSNNGSPALRGFSLIEVLVVVALLGLVAVFTVPKILNASSASKYTAIAKETATYLEGAMSNYLLESGLDTTSGPATLTPKMKYIKTVTSGSGAPTGETALETCGSGGRVCLLLANGGVLQYNSGNTFGGDSQTHAIYWNFDPDGAGTNTGRVTFVQYYDGRVTTYGALTTPASQVTTTGTTVAAQATNPTWIQTW